MCVWINSNILEVTDGSQGAFHYQGTLLSVATSVFVCLGPSSSGYISALLCQIVGLVGTVKPISALV